MVGSSIIRNLNMLGFKNLVFRERKELDLTNQSKVSKFFKREHITQVYLAAARVGGIYANNQFPADFIYENLMIQSNVIKSAFECGIKKILFLGSSCIYPKNCKQPMREQDLLNGQLESTNEPYALAKIAGIKLCESFNRQYGEKFGIDYRSIMPTNLFGPGDNYHPENSHVIPGLISRFHNAKVNNLQSVKVWGSGKPKREFLYVEDMAKACIHIMNIDKKKLDSFTSPMCSHINVGSGEDISIKQLAYNIKDIVGYNGKIIFDTSKPDGTIRKLLDTSLINKLGWYPKIDLKEGLLKTYSSYLKECS